jgi:hypothetical protein
VDFLEKNPDFAICFHNMQIIYENQPHMNKLSNINQQEITNIENLAYGNYIFTASCIFRKYLSEIPDWLYQCPVGDYPLHLLNAQYGKIKFIDEVMGVYRVHNEGMWGNTNYVHQMEKWLEMLGIIRYKFDKDINKIMRNNISLWHYKIAELLNGDLNRRRIFYHILKSIMVSPCNKQVSKKGVLKILTHQTFPEFYRRVKEICNQHK